MDDEDAPPLIDLNPAKNPETMGIEATLRDTSMVKVPITIVTGNIIIPVSYKNAKTRQYRLPRSW